MFTNLKRWLYTTDLDFVSPTTEGMVRLHNAASDLGLELVSVRSTHKYRPLVDTAYVSTIRCMPADVQMLRNRGVLN